MLGFDFGTGTLAVRRSAGAELFDFTTSPLRAGFSLNRSSGGSVYDAAGMLSQTGPDIARIWHDPLTLSPMGLLVEPERTNLCETSIDFEGAGWKKFGSCTLYPSAAIGPDGTSSGTTIEMNATGALLYYVAPVSAGLEYVFSYFLKAGTASTSYFSVYDQSSASWIVTPTAISNLSAAGQPAPNNWSRILVPFTAPAGCDTVRIYCARGQDSASLGTSHLFGVQLEQGQNATSYIATSGAAVTRAADVPGLGGVSGQRDVTVTYGSGDEEQFLAEQVTEGYWPSITQPFVARISISGT